MGHESTASRSVVALVLAGGEGSRLGSLTSERPKPLLPFAGSRLIDFTLSNCVNSGIRDVAVLVQYRARAIRRYLAAGEPWGLDCPGASLHTLSPAAGEEFLGTADAVRRHLDHPALREAETVLVLAADHVYAMDYRELLATHAESGADVTVGVVPVESSEAYRFGMVGTDARGQIVAFEEKPAETSHRLASMGIYAFKGEVLRALLGPGSDGADDFGSHILPEALEAGMQMRVHEFAGYWRDLGTPEAYLEATSDLVLGRAAVPGTDPAWPIHTQPEPRLHVMFGPDARVHRSLVLGAEAVAGSVERSVVMPGARIEAGAIVRDSVIMRGVRVGRGAVVDRAILDEGVTLQDGARVDGGWSSDELVRVIAANTVVPSVRLEPTAPALTPLHHFDQRHPRRPAAV